MIIDCERIDTLSPRYALFKEQLTVGITAIFSVTKEFQKPEKRKFWITFETLILIGAAWMLIGLLM
ncbi:hypothetical protein ACQKOA_21820 [Bacillus mobilis]|uniref:hypothetical protein n=1 Tax=Bacillus cereus group TaxID=86661 RepID=UPI001155C6E9|nr:hypothetical protein [Bacillus mobilis]MED0948668.1 hypothetical protein [Bacillus mobilis]MED1004741.1 hypothetical protein [Bacillus mobilis]